MATGSRYRVAPRRRRERKTDYKKRLKLLLSGKPRVIIRRTSRHTIVQIIDYDPEGDKVIASAHSNELKTYNWKGSTSNTSAAYLTGLLCGTKARKKGTKDAVLDTGLSLGSSKVFAALKGVLDSGLEIPYKDKILPNEKRIRGEHVASYAESIKDKKKRFSKYIEKGLDPTELPKHFDAVVSKVKGG
ncbi:MAG: 50S ribosomal protein L18 [Candidatus Hydrothermarchaeaceae archaeon]